MSNHTGIVNYHRRLAERQAYLIDADGVVGRLTSPEHVATQVTVSDVRDAAVAPTFEEDGIAFLRSRSAVSFADIENHRSAYELELEHLLTSTLDVVEVVAFDHTLRVDDPDAERRPARNVHADYSPHGARARLDRVLGIERAAEWANGHYAFINVWRPVSDVVHTAPLGFVRPRSVHPEDWLTLDLVYPDRIGQIMGLIANENHQWLYRSAMTPDEVVLFNIHDNRGRPAVAHSAIDLTHPRVEGRVRKSLESRTIVRYRTSTPDQDLP